MDQHSWPLSDEIRKNYGTDFSRIAISTSPWYMSLKADSIRFDRPGFFAEPDLARMLTLKMIYGNVEAVDDPSAILLSKSTAITYFGNIEPRRKDDGTFR
ncbi:MAG: hypothetical protein WDO15_19950 [Bacteroidota bacterium]